MALDGGSQAGSSGPQGPTGRPSGAPPRVPAQGELQQAAVSNCKNACKKCTILIIFKCAAQYHQVLSHCLCSQPPQTTNNSRTFSSSRTETGNTNSPSLTPGHKDPLEKEMTTHSTILAWRIP